MQAAVVTPRRAARPRRSARPLALAVLAALAACSDGTGSKPADQTAPAVQIQAPADGGVVNTTMVTVSGTATDNESVARVTYQLNDGAETNVPLTAGASVTYSFTVTLVSGANSIAVNAYDAAGNKTTARRSVSLDAAGPAVDVTSLPASSMVIVNSVRVAGTATDAGGVARLTYQVGAGAEQDVSITAGTSVNFDFPVAVQTGANTITVNAYDAAGNRTQLQRAVEVRESGAIMVAVLEAGSDAAVANAQITASVAQSGGSAARLPGGVAAEVLVLGNGLYTVEYLGNGLYRVMLPVGITFNLQISSSGALTATYSGITVVAGSVTYAETVRLITSAGGNGTISGEITDAFTGSPLGGVTLTLRAGLNATSGAAVTQTTTAADGSYSFSNVAAGYYTVEIAKSGYSGGFFTASLPGGQTVTRMGSIAPVVAEGQVRIVMDWGETPSDLDSHLTGPMVDGSGRFHTWFSDRSYYNGSTLVAALDRDDVDQYGPETTTIYVTSSGRYRFSVHDYSNRDQTAGSFELSRSGARVRVYRGGSLVRTFFVPTGQEGTLWTVFEMEGDNIIPINTMTYQSDPSVVTNRGTTDAALLRSLPAKTRK